MVPHDPVVHHHVQITTRIDKLCYGLDMNHVNPIECVCYLIRFCLVFDFSSRVTQKVVAGVYQGVTTVELDVRTSFSQLVSYVIDVDRFSEPCF